MVANTFARAAVLLAASRYVAAHGAAIIHNQCEFPVYLWSVSDRSADLQVLSANGGQYSEAYQTNPNGGGISIKVGRDIFGHNVTQFEYTLEGEGLWYDLSLIDGSPFVEYGVSVVPSEDSCRSVVCPAGIELCAAAYMQPTDNWATAKCHSQADTVVILCSGQEDTSGSDSVTSIASSAIATASPVTVFSTGAPTAVAATTADEEITTRRRQQWTQSVAQTTVKAQATAAAVTSAPVYVRPNGNVVVHTTFVTYVVTIEERDAAPTAAPVAKRQIHRHEHGQQQKRHEHSHVHHEVDA